VGHLASKNYPPTIKVQFWGTGRGRRASRNCEKVGSLNKTVVIAVAAGYTKMP